VTATATAPVILPVETETAAGDSRGAKHAVNGFTSSLRCELLHPQLWMSQHARISSGFLAGAAVIGGFLAGRLGRPR
jgi:hypothetical protein